MTERPKTRDEILALPKFGIRRWTETADANGVVSFGGRQMLATPGAKVEIPVIPKVYVSWQADEEPAHAVDDAGVLWTPVLTDDGWMRRDESVWERE